MSLFYKIFEIILKRNETTIQNKVLHEIIFHSFSLPISKKEPFVYRRKYKFLKESLNNPFFNEELKEEIAQLFSQIQKVSLALSRLLYYWKWKRSKIVIDTDLCMNPLSIKDKNVVCLYHENNRYLFIVSDLVNIFNNSLSYSPNFFSSPLMIKNPYNNIPFSKSNLYNIYFSLLFKCMLIPELIQKFFECSFDLDLFEKENQTLIRERAIHNYVKNMSENEHRENIECMIQKYNLLHKKKIEIDVQFPVKKLIDVFLPYLKLFFISIYSLDYEKRCRTKELLEVMLFRLKFHFPHFGKKKINVQQCMFLNHLTFETPTLGCGLSDKGDAFSAFEMQKGVEKKTFSFTSFTFDVKKMHRSKLVYSFNEEHPPFYTPKKNEHFLTSHISLIEFVPIFYLLEGEKYNVNYEDLKNDRIHLFANQLRRRNATGNETDIDEVINGEENYEDDTNSESQEEETNEEENNPGNQETQETQETEDDMIIRIY